MVSPVPTIISNPENKSVLPDVAETQPSEKNSPLFETVETPINQTPPVETAGVTQDAKPGEIVDKASNHQEKITTLSTNDQNTKNANALEIHFIKEQDTAHEQHS